MLNLGNVKDYKLSLTLSGAIWLLSLGFAILAWYGTMYWKGKQCETERGALLFQLGMYKDALGVLANDSSAVRR